MTATLTETTIEPLNGREYWDELRLFAKTFSDMQSHRIQTANRLGAASSLPAQLTIILDSLVKNEKAAALVMRKCFRRSGFVPFVKETVGVGEHLMALLLGYLGDPYVATPAYWAEDPTGKEKRILMYEPPRARSVSQLWAYCGHGKPMKRTKGMSQEDAFAMGNAQLKVIVYLISTCFVKQKPAEGEEAPYYRAIYDERRMDTADRVDAAGKKWTDGHSHADALRITGKEFLRDLWIEARSLHGVTD